jgi:hypothetical protein
MSLPTVATGADDAVVSVDTVAAIPPGESRLAFGGNVQMYVVREGGQPVAVGRSGKPVWSDDGRYLAWTVDERDGRGVTVANMPEDRTVYMLDSLTGQRVRYRDSALPLVGTLLPLSDGFAAVVTGKSNFGQAATDLVLLRPAELASGHPAEVVLPRFDLAAKVTDFDFTWVQARNDRLYVVITGTSVSYYHYSPQLWRVSLDGTALRLFEDCSAAAQCGLSNAGYPVVAVSPDGRHVAYESGTVVGGCDIFLTPGLRRSDNGETIRLQGLPVSDPSNGGARLIVHDIRWTSNEVFQIDMTTASTTITYDPSPRCETSRPVRQLFRCSVDGRCISTAVVTTSTIESNAGARATIQPPGDGQSVTTVDIDWTGRDHQQITVGGRGNYLAWAP